LPQVFALVRDQAEPGEIERYLASVAEQNMGLPSNRDRDRRTVKILMNWRDWIWKNTS